MEVEHPEPPVAASPGVSAKWNAPPRLNRVVPADLEVPARTAELFNQAATRDLLTDSPSSRLNFFAAAARARRLGTRNPGGFFAAIVRRQLWHHISAADEDAARHRIAQVPDFLHVQRPSPPVRTSILPTAPADPLVIRELIRRSLDAATALPVAAA